jgi:hypothetical protein
VSLSVSLGFSAHFVFLQGQILTILYLCGCRIVLYLTVDGRDPVMQDCFLIDIDICRLMNGSSCLIRLGNFSLTEWQRHSDLPQFVLFTCLSRLPDSKCNSAQFFWEHAMQHGLRLFLSIRFCCVPMAQLEAEMISALTLSGRTLSYDLTVARTRDRGSHQISLLAVSTYCT